MNVFGVDNGDNFLDALNHAGGPGLEDAQQILLRAAVATLLNVENGCNYSACGEDASVLISDVDIALASGDRDTMISLQSSGLF